MPTLLKSQHSITIDAPTEKVWKALTTPDQIKQWFFGVNTETNWKVGSPIIHRGEYQGKPYEDKGEVLKFEPHKELVHTTASQHVVTRPRSQSWRAICPQQKAKTHPIKAGKPCSTR